MGWRWCSLDLFNRHLCNATENVKFEYLTLMKFTGELKSNGTVRCACSFAKTNYQMSVNTAWCESVELSPFKAGSKSRKGFVWIKTYDASSVFGKVFMTVRVPAYLDDKSAAHEACWKAHRVGKGYSWSMWARVQIMQKYSSLSGEPSFCKSLQNLVSEWMPRNSEEGRMKINKILKLGSFEAVAFESLPPQHH